MVVVIGEFYHGMSFKLWNRGFTMSIYSHIGNDVSHENQVFCVKQVREEAHICLDYARVHVLLFLIHTYCSVL